jgi:hypothetical protein
MDGPAPEPSLAAIVESIESRSAQDTELLSSRLRSGCWPGGMGDRSEPRALEWVRRWGPSRLTAEPLSCSCVRGRCSVCN